LFWYRKRFLCLFLRRIFLRLCTAILWRFLFFPQGMNFESFLCF